MKNLALIIAAAFVLAGCAEKSTEPKADVSVHVDTDKTKNDVAAAMDKAGEELKKGAETAKDKLEDAGDALKKNAEAAKDKLSNDKSVDIEVKTK
jgi:hypothetical protein